MDEGGTWPARAERALAFFTGNDLEDARMHRVGFAVVVLPGRVPQDSPHSEIGRRMLALAAEDGFPAFDAEAALRADPDPRRVAFPHEGHFTPYGCERVAAAVAPFLRASLDAGPQQRLHRGPEWKSDAIRRRPRPGVKAGDTGFPLH